MNLLGLREIWRVEGLDTPYGRAEARPLQNRCKLILYRALKLTLYHALRTSAGIQGCEMACAARVTVFMDFAGTWSR